MSLKIFYCCENIETYKNNGFDAETHSFFYECTFYIVKKNDKVKIC